MRLNPLQRAMLGATVRTLLAALGGSAAAVSEDDVIRAFGVLFVLAQLVWSWVQKNRTVSPDDV